MRTELMDVKLKIRGKETQQYADLIKLFTDAELENINDVDLSYTFNIEYWGQTKEKIGALVELIKGGVEVKEASVKEIHYGESLIKELLVRIEEVRKVLIK